MNANEPMQEKDFNRLIEGFTRFNETQAKMICEIELIIDRMKPDTKKKDISPDEPKKPMMQMDGIIYILNNRVAEIDNANERLSCIIRRLNELF